MTSSAAILVAAFRNDGLECDAAFVAAAEAANLPELSDIEAAAFARGVPETIAFILSLRPELAAVEDFLEPFVFGGY
jgi:hypothetical protein